jgi:hypothetical protein
VSSCQQLPPHDVLRDNSPLLSAYPWYTGVVLRLPNFLGNVGDDNLMGVRQTLIHTCLSHSLINQDFLSTCETFVAIPKTMMFNPCWESKSTKRGKHYQMFWWNIWDLRVQVSSFQCLQGITLLMWLHLWKGCVLTKILVISFFYFSNEIFMMSEALSVLKNVIGWWMEQTQYVLYYQ